MAGLRAMLAESARWLGLAAGLRRTHRGLASPVEVVARRGTAEVLRFRRPPGVPAPAFAGAPLLLVPSIINRAYVLDLADGQSLARAFVERGVDVFIVDWGEPGLADAHLDLAAYSLSLLPWAIEAVRDAVGAVATTAATGLASAAATRVAPTRPSVDLLGYCLGGTFALIAGARRVPGIRRIVALAAPVDLGAPGRLGLFSDPRLLDPDGWARALPIVPGAWLWAGFQGLDPVSIAGKWRSLLWRADDLGAAVRFLGQERWNHDPVDVTGRALRDVVVRLYRDNALARGTLVLAGLPVRLADGVAPVLNVIAAKDTIVPPEASRPLARLWGGPVRAVELPGGHIGVTVGARAAEGLWRIAAEWLAADVEPPAGSLDLENQR